MGKVEFEFPSKNEPLMFEYSEMYNQSRYNYDEDDCVITEFDINTFDVTGTVGSIPVSVMEQVFEKPGGINWEKSCTFQNETN